MLHKTALLMLDDGTCFEGVACGACQEAVGEVVFTTGMCGYQEVLTDPAHLGQIVSFTAAHIGNYGTNPYDNEAPGISASGAVFHDLYTAAEDIPFPHWQADASLDKKMRDSGLTGIHSIDTRALTAHLREHGDRNGIISAIDLDKASLLHRAKELPTMQGQDLAGTAGEAKRSIFETPADADKTVLLGGEYAPGKIFKVALLDLGVARSFLLHLCASGMNPELWPAKAPAADILASKPDAVVISNGPGDPAACSYIIQTVRELLGQVPLLGVGLGHQIIGLAQGGKTFKMSCGHHNLNHPVKHVKTGKVLITRQNHNFSLDPDSLPQEVLPAYWNLNDGTLEGMESPALRVLSAQFYPVSAPGLLEDHDLGPQLRRLVLGAK